MNKKGIVYTVLLFLLLIVFPVPPARADGDISVLINNQPLNLEVSPQVVNGRTLVPLGAIFEALGASVEWNPADQSITATKGDQVLKLTVGSSTAYNNGSPVQMDTPPQIINGRTLVPLGFVSQSMGAQVSWDANTRQVSIVSSGQTSLQPSVPAGRISPARIDGVVRETARQYRQFTVVDKLAPSAALSKQINALRQQSDVDIVEQLSGSSDLRVRFKDGYEIVMLQGGPDALGSSTLSIPQPAAVAAPEVHVPAALDILKKSGFKPENILLDPQQYQTPSPSRFKAAVFDTAYDNPIHMETPVDNDVCLKLKQMGYYVDLYKSWADLSFASKLDDQAYAVIYFCGHGAMVGGDWYFTVRPYYDSPPPDDSGYTGTKVFSVYTGNGYDIAYVYGFGKEFAQTYWTNAFRGTIFMVESCNSANSSIVSSLPRWTIDHGASAWLGWNGSVKIKVGDQVTPEFFNQLGQWKSVEEARIKVNFINSSKPPEVIRVASTEPTYKANADVSLPHWAWEANEQQYPAGKNFYIFTAEKYGEDAYLYIYSVLNMPLFHLYLDNNADGKADVDVKFTPDSYEVYSVASDGKTNLEQFGKVSNLSGGYRAVIPWATLFGSGVLNRYRLADGSSGDVMPDNGWLSAADGTVITTPDVSTGGGTGGTGNGSFGAAASTDSSLIAEYKFNGDFKDATGRGNDGIKAGEVSFAEDSIMGKCAVFNGGFINVKSVSELNLGDNFTISLWVKVDTANKVNPMLSKTTDNGSYNIYNFLTRSTYGIEADLPTSSGPGMVLKDGPFTDLHLDDGWSHLVFTRDGSTVYAYHNGVQIAKRDFYTRDGKMQSSIGNMRIGNGSDINHKDVLFKGKMDDLRIYNRTLSAAEILALYNGGTPTGN